MTAVDEPEAKPAAFWVPTLYFAEGLPFAVVAVVASIVYQRRGLSNEMITFYTGMLLTPWSLKPFWSPLLEMFKTKKFWVVTTQLLSGVGMCLVALSLPLPGYLTASLALLGLVAFCSATHDIAADGLYLSSLSEKEISAWAGVQSAAWQAGKIFGAGLLVYIAGFLEERVGVVRGWVSIFFVLGGLMIALAMYHSRVLPTGARAHRVSGGLKPSSQKAVVLYVLLLAFLGGVAWTSGRVQAMLAETSYGVLAAWAFMMAGVAMFLLLAYQVAVASNGSSEGTRDGVETLSDVIVTLLQKRNIYLYMAFIFLYRAGEGQINRIGPLFLLDKIENGGLALTPKMFGIIYGTLGTLAQLLGSIVGGYFASRVGLKRALFWLCLGLNLPNLAFFYLSSMMPTSHYLIGTAVVFETFGYGFGFVGVIVLMMQEIAPGKYQTAHYAFATAIMNVGLQLPGIVSGTVQQHLGYRNFFIWVVLCGLPSLIMARFIPIHGSAAREAQAAEA